MTGTLSMARILAISATLCLISSSACQTEEIFYLHTILVNQKSVDSHLNKFHFMFLLKLLLPLPKLYASVLDFPC